MASYTTEYGPTAVSRFSGKEYPTTAEFWFPFRAIPGALHLNSRPRAEEKEYRARVAAEKAAGTRVTKSRPRSPAVVETPFVSAAILAGVPDESPRTPREPEVRVSPFAAAFAARS